MKPLLTLLLSFALLSQIFAQQKLNTIATTNKTSSKIVKQIKNNRAYLIDVRTPEEYRPGHLKYSKNIDFKNMNFKTQLAGLDKKRPIYLYCRTGNRSGKAVDTLRILGFKHVYNIGGFEDLKLAGLPQD